MNDRLSRFMNRNAFSVKLLPWLALLIILIFLTYPLPWLVTGISILNDRFEMVQSGFNSDFGESRLIAESAHFRLVAYERYADPVVTETFLTRAEKQYPAMLAFLGLQPGDHIITIMLLPGCQVSRPGNNFLTINSCNSELQPYFSNVFLHELTHLLARSAHPGISNSFFNEGLAVATAKMFDWSYPWTLDDTVFLLETLREGKLIPLSDMLLGIAADPWDPDTLLRYAEAGSFAGYLIDVHGIGRFLSVSESGGDFEDVYGLTVDQLEHAWLRRLSMDNLVLSLSFGFAALIELGLISFAITNGRRWVPAAAFGWLGILLWSFLLFTAHATDLLYVLLYRPKEAPPIPMEAWTPARVPAGLLVAGLLGLLVSRWSKRGGEFVLWLAGAATLIIFLFIPAIKVFIR